MEGTLDLNLLGSVEAYVKEVPVALGGGPGSGRCWRRCRLRVIASCHAELAAALRSQLAGKRMLVILDNAADAEQVRSMIPFARGCAVLINQPSAVAEKAMERLADARLVEATGLGRYRFHHPSGYWPANWPPNKNPKITRPPPSNVR